MAEVVENGQCLLPGLAGVVRVVCAVVGVAEVSEDLGLTVAIAKVPEQVHGVVVAVEGVCVPAEVVVGATEAVQGVGLPRAVTEYSVEGERLPAVVEAPLVVA